ncbi:hypothetical protein MsAg5_07600 [Methanosarcinaceae archaeon Ag5]|uniref:Uncharacterized protein n=1 Tax=Methanolapillus africanus TaxID=3028297 RepID=A0AAE4MJR4_9EURY|nr:hypothetical protein [Methanosarcinaceae archaeon Ag5]
MKKSLSKIMLTISVAVVIALSVSVSGCTYFGNDTTANNTTNNTSNNTTNASNTSNTSGSSNASGSNNTSTNNTTNNTTNTTPSTSLPVIQVTPSTGGGGSTPSVKEISIVGTWKVQMVELNATLTDGPTIPFNTSELDNSTMTVSADGACSFSMNFTGQPEWMSNGNWTNDTRTSEAGDYIFTFNGTDYNVSLNTTDGTLSFDAFETISNDYTIDVTTLVWEEDIWLYWDLKEFEGSFTTGEDAPTTFITTDFNTSESYLDLRNNFTFRLHIAPGGITIPDALIADDLTEWAVDTSTPEAGDLILTVAGTEYKAYINDAGNLVFDIDTFTSNTFDVSVTDLIFEKGHPRA